MKSSFDKISILSPLEVTLKNRLVMAPMTTWSGMPNGELSLEELDYYGARSGGVGMVITATTYMEPQGQGFENQFYAGNDATIPSLAKLAQVIHKGGALAVLQAFHAGRKANPKVVPLGQTFSASAIPAKRELDLVPKEMSEEDIHNTIESFYAAVWRAHQAGFDGFEIHGANTYLLQQFFSPHSNQRQDQWGGTLEKRARFPLAVVVACMRAAREIRSSASGNANFFVGYRFSPEENSQPGITLSDTFYLIDQLCETPLDYLHVSLGAYNQGSIRQYSKAEDNDGILLERIATKIRGRKILIGVGGVRQIDQVQAALHLGADLVAMGRQLIVDPQTVEKWQTVGGGAFSLYDPALRESLKVPFNLHRMIIERQDWIPLKPATKEDKIEL